MFPLNHCKSDQKLRKTERLTHIFLKTKIQQQKLLTELSLDIPDTVLSPSNYLRGKRQHAWYTVLVVCQFLLACTSH